MADANRIIERLQLQPHPEGGWYRETWRADAANGERAGGTAIHFLLEAGQRSHWHKVDAAEIWLFHAGDPLRLSLSAGEAGPVRGVVLGSDVLAGHAVQHVVLPGEWQAAEPGPVAQFGYSLVSCVVVPGFDFAGFTLAPEGWAPGGQT
ncbi:MAG: cupin domain-containing protein [Candidatus Andeanibacterium colombiense]|uniref:Cupin domain-containing protein n=1 Tax=Candidatus Andeanibacterium colombiense TaxID=3121345 RepID=A0AAJ5XBU0_9SPHN|nr:MAG: cupin domain-containing protein [Sphingomonadaceae bacterium]